MSDWMRHARGGVKSLLVENNTATLYAAEGYPRGRIEFAGTGRSPKVVKGCVPERCIPVMITGEEERRDMDLLRNIPGPCWREGEHRLRKDAVEILPDGSGAVFR